MLWSKRHGRTNPDTNHQSLTLHNWAILGVNVGKCSSTMVSIWERNKWIFYLYRYVGSPTNMFRFHQKRGIVSSELYATELDPPRVSKSTGWMTKTVLFERPPQGLFSGTPKVQFSVSTNPRKKYRFWEWTPKKLGAESHRTRRCLQRPMCVLEYLPIRKRLLSKRLENRRKVLSEILNCVGSKYAVFRGVTRSPGYPIMGWFISWFHGTSQKIWLIFGGAQPLVVKHHHHSLHARWFPQTPIAGSRSTWRCSDPHDVTEKPRDWWSRLKKCEKSQAMVVGKPWSKTVYQENPSCAPLLSIPSCSCLLLQSIWNPFHGSLKTPLK